MIARAIETLFYQSAVRGTHKALSDMGFIPTDATGTQAEQVRAVVGPAQPDTPAIADAPDKPSRRKPAA